MQRVVPLALAAFSVFAVDPCAPPVMPWSFETRVRVLTSSPISPVVWATTGSSSNNPIYRQGTTASAGLKKLAEEGDPTALLAELRGNNDVKSFGVAYADSNTKKVPIDNTDDDVAFGVSGTPGDRLFYAAMLGRSNDRFLAPPQAGLSLFQCTSPWYGQRPAVLWDAGTEANEPYFANLNIGIAQSHQPGGALPGGNPGEGTISQVADWEFSPLAMPNNISFPRPDSVISVTINPSFDVTLAPSLRGSPRSNVTVQYTFQTQQRLGNEVRLLFPPDFDLSSAVASPIVPGVLQPASSVVINKNTAAFSWPVGTQLQLATYTVKFMFWGVRLPNNCDVNEFTLTTHDCVNLDVLNQGVVRQYYCGKPKLSLTAAAPSGAATGCTLCNACRFLYTSNSKKVWECENGGNIFIREGDLPTMPCYPMGIAV